MSPSKAAVPMVTVISYFVEILLIIRVKKRVARRATVCESAADDLYFNVVFLAS